MVLVLVIGDSHVPHRAPSIPQKFQGLLKPGKIQHVLCTGNVTSQSTYNYLKSLPSGKVHTVLGDMDNIETVTAQDQLKLNIGDFKIGLVHGHQIVPWNDEMAVEAYRRQMNVDILVSGHTHECSVQERDSGFFVNPGSCTGAINVNGDKNQPSFVLLDISSNSCVTYVYRLKEDNEVAVDKHEFKKQVVESN